MIRLYLTILPKTAPEPPYVQFSSYRKEKLSRQKNKLARLQSVYAELLLRYAMGDIGYKTESPLLIACRKDGKPYLCGKEIFFNLSHSRNAVLCAISDREVGADVQAISGVQRALTERRFRPDERAYVAAAKEPEVAFAEIWAKKESFCKASGLGLRCPLDSFSVFDENVSRTLWHTGIGDFQIAVCCAEKIPSDLQIQQIDPAALL